MWTFPTGGLVVRTHSVPSHQLYIPWTGLNTCHPSNQESDCLCFCLCRLAEQRQKSPLAAADPPDADGSQWIYHTAPPTAAFVTSPCQQHVGKLSHWTRHESSLCLTSFASRRGHWSSFKKKKSSWWVWVSTMAPTASESSQLAKLDSEIHIMSRLSSSVQCDDLCAAAEAVHWLSDREGKRDGRLLTQLHFVKKIFFILLK